MIFSFGRCCFFVCFVCLLCLFVCFDASSCCVAFDVDGGRVQGAVLFAAAAAATADSTAAATAAATTAATTAVGASYFVLVCFDSSLAKCCCLFAADYRKATSMLRCFDTLLYYCLRL